MTPDEIISEMETFTADEKDRINLLAANKVENITFEDMELYSRWQTSLALADARFQAECKALQAKTQAEIEQQQAIKQVAFENLEAQAQLAQARLKAVQDGKIS